MSDSAHSAGAEGIGHVPYFITAPGETDTMLVGVIVVMALVALGLGVFYLRLHSLPEQMAHESNHTQMQIVAILGLIALFSHNNIFWIAALLLAAFKFPDYAGTFNTISASLERIARKVDGADRTASGSTEDPETDADMEPKAAGH